jgi:hypothetical protein
MKKAEELTVIAKTYDLILWSCNHTGKFPRNHRFVLGERIERNLYNLLETLIAAKYTKNRQRLLEDPNLALEVLRFQMRLAKALQCQNVESYAFAARSISSRRRICESGSRSSWSVHLKRFSIPSAPKSSQQMLTQRCPSLRHTLLHRHSTLDRALRYQISGSRLNIEQNPFHDLLNDRP